MLSSLRARLLASYVMIILVCLSLVGTVAFVLLQGFRINNLKINLAERAVPMAYQVYRMEQEGRPASDIRAVLTEQTAEQDIRVFLVDQGGRVLLDTLGSRIGETFRVPVPPQKSWPESGAPRVTGELRVPSGEMLIYGGAVTSAPGNPNARHTWVVLASPLRGGTYLLADLLRRLLLAAGIALLLSVGVAALITRSIGRPINRVIKATEQVAAGDYDLHLDIQSPDEVRRLADSFNVMAGKVEASRQTQRDFLANVSHELRTPLTSIRGFAGAILDGAVDDPESQRRAAQVIHQESERMIRMVEELLDLAKIEAGQIKMDLHPVDMRALVENTARRMQPQADAQEIRLTLEIGEPPVVQGDGDRLVQVLTNLVDNALRHTPADGQVTIGLQPAGTDSADERPAAAQLSVTDTGPGIPPAELSRLFERFYQVDKSRARTQGGTGLGLAIAQEIVEAHGGTIRVESIEGLGTRFVVELPAWYAT